MPRKKHSDPSQVPMINSVVFLIGTGGGHLLCVIYLTEAQKYPAFHPPYPLRAPFAFPPLPPTKTVIVFHLRNHCLRQKLPVVNLRNS